MAKILPDLDRGSGGDRQRIDRRLARVMKMAPMVAAATARLREQGRWPETVRVRPHFVYRRTPAPGDPSDRRLPERRHRPPATRILSPNGIALRLYLIALFEAQMHARPGRRPANRLPLRAGGSETGWIDLIAVPVERHGSGTTSASVSDKKQRRVLSALKHLADLEVQLVHLPQLGMKTGKYEGFQLLDEGGVRENADAIPYVIPRKNEHAFDLPTGLFENGWIHVLEDTELAFVMMLACRLHEARREAQVKVQSDERILHFGLGRDAYEAHMTLAGFGLVDVEVDENRHHDGKVRDFGRGGEARLHTFRLLWDGFGEPAAATVLRALRRARHRGYRW
ncbi:MAG: hypothetical protein GEV03_19105 [Streptosporangiales bacterium]|nr:hypothetical protein [Streptosporangiales bacterium]